MNVTEIAPEGIALGAVRMRTRFSFRQRNLIPTLVDSRLLKDDNESADKEEDSSTELTASTRSKLANALKLLS